MNTGSDLFKKVKGTNMTRYEYLVRCDQVLVDYKKWALSINRLY